MELSSSKIKQLIYFLNKAFPILQEPELPWKKLLFQEGT